MTNTAINDLSVRDLVSLALARREKVVLANILAVSPMLISRWLSGSSVPEEEHLAKLRAIAAEPDPGQPPADDKLTEEPKAAPGPEDDRAGKTIGPDPDAPVKVPAPAPEPPGGEPVASAVNAMNADRARHEADVADMAALVASPGWQRLVQPQVLAKRETHRNALLDAKGRDVPLNQGAYAALDWLVKLVRKPAEELAAAKADMPLFSDAGEPGGEAA